MEISVVQFHYLEIDEETVFIYNKRMASHFCAEKTRRGGLRAIRVKPVRIPIFKKECFGGAVNPFWLSIRTQNYAISVGKISSRIFGINKKVKIENEFFNRTNLGNHSFFSMIKKCLLQKLYNEIVKINTSRLTPYEPLLFLLF